MRLVAGRHKLEWAERVRSVEVHCVWVRRQRSGSRSIIALPVASGRTCVANSRSRFLPQIGGRSSKAAPRGTVPYVDDVVTYRGCALDGRACHAAKAAICSGVNCEANDAIRERQQRGGHSGWYRVAFRGVTAADLYPRSGWENKTRTFESLATPPGSVCVLVNDHDLPLRRCHR